MENMNEELLNSWIELSLAICNEKVVSDLPYNESVICNILYRNQNENVLQGITATELCSKMKMQKSQMNRTLTSMEEKCLITRKRSKDDKRQVFIYPNPENAEVYNRQHAKILKITDAVIEKFGETKAKEMIAMFDAVAEVARKVII